jgi:hypothetical protein
MGKSEALPTSTAGSEAGVHALLSLYQFLIWRLTQQDQCLKYTDAHKNCNLEISLLTHGFSWFIIIRGDVGLL